MDLELDKVYPVKVTKILQKGIIVELEDQSTQFIHVSQISDKFVADPNNFVHVDSIYQAKGIKGKARPIELSLKHLKLSPIVGSSTTPVTKEHKKKQNSTNIPSDLDAMIQKSQQVMLDKFASKTKRRNRRK